jgi:hypothetical protein
VRTLDPRLKLERLPQLRLDLDAAGAMRIETEDTVVACDLRGLAVLDLFSRPTSLEEAVRRLRGRVTGAQDWIELTSTILRLYEAGVLREVGAAPARLPADAGGFDSPAMHVALLDDRRRVQAYLDAIRETVRPGDVVLDLGTGTGLLAVAAARAGASRVYAVETGAIGRVAQDVFRVNDVAARVTLVAGWASQIELPERAHVLVSEIIGNDPLGEGVLEATIDARRRLLQPEARLVPRSLRVMGLPVTIPAEVLGKHRAGGRALQRWREWYGIDFGPLAAATREPHVLYQRPHKVRAWKTLKDPVELARLDFATAESAAVEATVVTTASAAGELNGLLVYFDADLSPGARISTHPAAADEHCCWRVPVWILPRPLVTQPGDRLEITYRHRAPGGRGRVTVSRV